MGLNLCLVDKSAWALALETQIIDRTVPLPTDLAYPLGRRHEADYSGASGRDGQGQSADEPREHCAALPESFAD
jgi:hypothetical protein